jgi:hypothetical protein
MEDICIQDWNWHIGKLAGRKQFRQLWLHVRESSHLLSELALMIRGTDRRLLHEILAGIDTHASSIFSGGHASASACVHASANAGALSILHRPDKGPVDMHYRGMLLTLMSRFSVTTTFKVNSHSRDVHHGDVSVSVLVNGNVLAEGQGHSKASAAEAACKKICVDLLSLQLELELIPWMYACTGKTDPSSVLLDYFSGSRGGR